MHYEGEDVAEDLPRAHMSLSIVAERGYSEAAKSADADESDSGAISLCRTERARNQRRFVTAAPFRKHDPNAR